MVDVGTDRHAERVRRFFTFPNPVNEVSARLVAAGVVVMAVLAITFGLRFMTFVLAYGFVARVLAGPRLSPLALFVTRVVTPRLGLPERPVPGPPKRFAQAIGAAFSLTALVLTVLGFWTAAEVVLGLLAAAAVLGVGLRRVPGLHGLRAADAGRGRARGGVRALPRHLGRRHRVRLAGGLMLSPIGRYS